MFFIPKRRGQPAWLVAFLGNPGAKYDKTRHNAGYMAAAFLESEQGIKIRSLKFKSLTELCTLGGAKALAIKPQTFMNLSGQAVREAAAFYRIPADHIIVVCDDTALPLGKLRIRRQGSAGGHNGLKSIISCLGTDAFLRVKIGVGAPSHPEHDLVDWVIGRMSDKEYEQLLASSKEALRAVEAIIEHGVEAAMNKFN
ncbi:MAG: aminoacyl-tRNA hydrolase [Clostridiales bacterium]|nr:aminoacyl-tRNA hydrolase [Clostridiales bacterium]